MESSMVWESIILPREMLKKESGRMGKESDGSQGMKLQLELSYPRKRMMSNEIWIYNVILFVL